MTDNEIIKALEICIKSITYYECEKCPYYDDENEPLICIGNLLTDVLDLINRLQAENERLNGCVKSEEEVREIAKRTMEPLVKEITKEQIDTAVKLAKAEAYKEFAERLKENAFPLRFATNTEIDNLLKELVGEDK